jgi:phthiocerol/phenolphthiocerol synthesis type-I polyketide synthase C
MSEPARDGTKDDAGLDPMRRALVTIRDLRARLERAEQADNEPVAVIGMGCRLPGGVNSPEELWNLLREGRTGIGPVPPDRWDVDALYSADRTSTRTIYIGIGWFLD